MQIPRHALLVVIVIFVGVGVAVVAGTVSRNQSKPAANTSSSQSSSLPIRTPEEDKALVKTSLASITSAIETSDKEKFATYVDSAALCDSIYTAVYSSFEKYLPKAALDKTKITSECLAEVNNYVADPSVRGKGSDASILTSLEDVFSKAENVTVERKGQSLNATIVVEGTPSSFLFTDTGAVARLSGFAAQVSVR